MEPHVDTRQNYVRGFYVVYVEKLGQNSYCSGFPIGDVSREDWPEDYEFMRPCDEIENDLEFTICETLIDRRPDLSHRIAPHPPTDGPMFLSQRMQSCQLVSDVEIDFFEGQTYVDMNMLWSVYGFLIQDQWIGVLIPTVSRRWLIRQISWSIRVYGNVPLHGNEWALRDAVGMKQDFAVVRPR